METKDILNRLIYILIFTLTSLLLEFITFYCLGFGVFPTYFLFNISFILIISGVLFLISNRKAKLIIIITTLAIQVILNCINVCYYDVLGDIFSFDLLKLGTETVRAFSFNFIKTIAMPLHFSYTIITVFW